MSDERESDWEREKAFWAACKVQTYDLEYTGWHCGGWEMLKQSHDPSGTNHGDWVRAEDFRSRVEELERELAQYRRCGVSPVTLERELQSAAQEANDLNRTVERLTQELAAERERNDGYNFMCREAEEAKEAAESALADERGWQWRPTATDTAFAPPFGTIRQCRVCGCLVAGGPTACARCAEAGA